MSLSPAEMLEYLKGRGCRVGGVTLGERGLLRYDGSGAVSSTAALAVPPERILDTSGAGDCLSWRVPLLVLGGSHQDVG
jgi:sugar/nucleoside kinase (ribokinase family)